MAVQVRLMLITEKMFGPIRPEEAAFQPSGVNIFSGEASSTCCLESPVDPLDENQLARVLAEQGEPERIEKRGVYGQQVAGAEAASGNLPPALDERFSALACDLAVPGVGQEQQVGVAFGGAALRQSLLQGGVSGIRPGRLSRKHRGGAHKEKAQQRGNGKQSSFIFSP